MKIIDFYDLMIETLENNKTFTIPIKGTSMRPLLKTGDNVELKKDLNIKKNDIIFYKRDNYEFVLHRAIKIKGDYYIVVGDHQTKLEIVNKNQVIAKAIKYNNKDFKGLKYKLYLFSLKFLFVRFFYKKFF